jgi:hypothetical protein
MLYEAVSIFGFGWLSKILIQDAFFESKQPRKREMKATKKKMRAIQNIILTDEQKWDHFVAVKRQHRKSIGLPDEKIHERALIAAEKALQSIDKGFYTGDAVELGLEVGKAFRFPLFLDWSKLNNHYIFYGTTRFGKTRALANHLRQFIEKGYDVFLIDPKGGEKHELLGWAAEFANEFGRMDDLMLFNPVYPMLTDYFNPLFGKENNEIASELKLYAQGDPKNKDDFFMKRIPQVVNAIGTACEYLERVYDIDGKIVKGEIEEEIRKYVVSRITNGHKVVFEKDTMTMTPDLSFRSTERIVEAPKRTTAGAFKRKLMTFKDFAYYSMYDNLISLKASVVSTPIPPLNNKEKEEDLRTLRDEALSLISGAAGVSKEHYENTTGSLVELLTKLSTGSIGRMFCTTPINPILLRMQSPEKGVIAVIQPNPLKYQSVSEMIMKIFLKNFETTFGNVAASGRALSRKTVVIIDEASKAMFPGIEELFNKLGGLGASFGLYTQSQADMIMMLGKDTASVIRDNINTVAYMKTNDPNSKREANEDFGQRKIVDYQMQQQGGIGGMGRAGVTADLQDLAHKDSFEDLQIGQALMKHYGKRYFIELPFQPAPSSYMIMPQLSSEKVTGEMIEFMSLLESETLQYQRRTIKNYDEEDGLYGAA